MIFLNPTILFGLLAASIPIVLHFLNLRKIKKIEFSTLAFLKELQKSKIRKIKIKQLLLLLLRILIILFLVASFARPTLESTTLASVGSKAKTTAVFILDNSFSMSVIDANGSYLNQAKEQIKNIMSNFQSGDDLFLILTSELSKEVNTFKSFKEIENVDVSSVTKPFVKSLKIASQILNTSNNFNKEVFIFSDFQKSTFLEKDSTNFNLKIKNAKFYLFNFGENQIQNYSITNTFFNNQIFELNKEITITSEIKTTSSINEVDKLVSLFLNNNRVAQKNFSVLNNGTIQINFQATIENTGLVEVLSTIEDDAIEHDNSFYSHFFVPSDISLLIVSSVKGESKFIRAALSTSKNTKFKIKEIHPNDFMNTNLSDYNTVVVIGSELYEYSENLNSYINSGGSVLLFPGDGFILSDFNKLLLSLNLPQTKSVVKLSDATSAIEFESIDYKHPIFAGLFADNKHEIESPQIYKYLKFNISSSGRSIILLQDGSPFLSEYIVGKGKVLFFGTSPLLTWSTFPVKNIFAPLINRSISYLNTNINSTERLFAGDEIDVNVSKRKSAQIKVIKPDKTAEFINHDFESGNYLKYKNSSTVGTYMFYSSSELLDVKSVNVNPLESNFEKISQDKFADQLEMLNNSVIKIIPSDDYISKITTARYGSELWKLFLIIALLLALLEMYIARSAKKDLATIEN
ncbi:MAG: BatA domain-containing protein [Melioribacteraceae bacterium]|nr:BatA domain-containing protein [Melioribacteraceae bacterium]